VNHTIAEDPLNKPVGAIFIEAAQHGAKIRSDGQKHYKTRKNKALPFIVRFAGTV
jgi:hypothetical protein